MIIKIVKKEFLEMIRDGRFRWAVIIVASLLLVSLATGWKSYKEAERERQISEQSDRHIWENQGNRNPHSAAHFGMYAFKPTPALSFIDRGVNSYLGVAVWMEAHWQNPFRYRPAEDATSLQRFGELTAALVLQILVPLLIILLSFSTFSGEREQGTLRQLFSLGLKPGTLAMGKAVGVAVALLTLLIPAAIIGLIAVALSAAPQSPLLELSRFTLMVCAYLLYFGAFIAISLAVSAKTRSSQTALLILLVFWIANCLVLPRAASDFAQGVYPSPSHAEFWSLVNEDFEKGIDGHNPTDSRRTGLEKAVLKQYGVDKLESLPINFDGIALQAGEDYGNQIFDKHYGKLWETFEKQNSLHKWGAVVAPLIAVRSFSMSMAGTDFAQHRHFSSAAENFRRKLNKLMNDDLTHNSRTGEWNYLANESLWKKAPEFHYEPPTLSWIFAHQASSAILLVLWFLGACAATVMCVKQIRPVE